jgi:hypothetical protein
MVDLMDSCLCTTETTASGELVTLNFENVNYSKIQEAVWKEPDPESNLRIWTKISGSGLESPDLD